MTTETQFFIQRLEGQLTAMIELHPTDKDSQWLLVIKLNYDGSEAGKTSFNLHGYTEEEATNVARNISNNPYIMKEIDEYLWGESD